MLEDFGRKKHHWIYFVLLAFMVVLVFVLSASFQVVPRVFGVTATPLVALTIAAGFFNSELTGFFIGLFSGVLMDVISDKWPGFHTVLLLLIGVTAALLAEHLIHRRFTPCLVMSLALIAGYDLLYWLCFYFSQGLFYFVRVSVVHIVYTWLFMIPFYWLMKWYSQKLLK